MVSRNSYRSPPRYLYAFHTPTIIIPSLLFRGEMTRLPLPSGTLYRHTHTHTHTSIFLVLRVHSCLFHPEPTRSRVNMGTKIQVNMGSQSPVRCSTSSVGSHVLLRSCVREGFSSLLRLTRLYAPIAPPPLRAAVARHLRRYEPFHTVAARRRARRGGSRRTRTHPVRVERRLAQH